MEINNGSQFPVLDKSTSQTHLQWLTQMPVLSAEEKAQFTLTIRGLNLPVYNDPNAAERNGWSSRLENGPTVKESPKQWICEDPIIEPRLTIMASHVPCKFYKDVSGGIS